MDVSVIIVNYNTWQMTAECIDSVFEKTIGINFEVILIDNGSTDGSKEYFEKDARIHYIYSEENLGFGKANNLGIKVARGKNIFLLNSDTLLINNAIKILSVCLDEHPEIAIVGGQLMNRDREKVHSFSCLFPGIVWELNILLNMKISQWLEKRVQYSAQSRSVARVAYITGADMMIRREVLQTLGAFDPVFFMYFEETELTFRYKRAGKNAYFHPAAQIIHLENASCKISEKKERMFLESRCKYYSLCFSARKRWMLNGIFTITCLSRIILARILHMAEKKNFWETRYEIFREVQQTSHS